jgi:hypothetical protein
MKHVLFTLFAISLAGVAAIAATTAMLNTPVHNIGAPTPDKKPDGNAPTPTTPAPDTPAPTDKKPASIPDADKPLPGGTSKPAAEPAGGAKPAGDSTAGAAKPANPDDDKEDKDPYEGIAPEDLPPDLQYDADSSVSFPTNT